MSKNLPIVSCTGFFVLRHHNHFVLAGANDRNVITYRFLAAPVQANREFFYIDCMTVYFNSKYFPNIRASCLSASSGLRLLGEIPAGAITVHL